MKYTENGILFNNVLPHGMRIESLFVIGKPEAWTPNPLISSSNIILNIDVNKGVINAVDINWNSAEVEEDVIINSTADLLNYIKSKSDPAGSRPGRDEDYIKITDNLLKINGIWYRKGEEVSIEPGALGPQGDKGDKGDKGDSGKGVQSITTYFLASSSASGITTSTSGWTTNPTDTNAKISSSKKYLWSYQSVKYTDNTTTVIGPTILGAYGDTGSGSSGSNVSYQNATLNSSGKTTYDIGTITINGQNTTLKGMYESGTGGGATTLNGLSDVTISSPSTNLVLTYNGSKWVNKASQGGTGTNYTAGEGIEISNNQIKVKAATSSSVGGIKLNYQGNNKNYALQVDSNGRAFVNVPWVGGGDDAVNGSYDLFAYKTVAKGTTVTAPTSNATYPPSGWQLYPQTASDGYIIYAITRTVTFDSNNQPSYGSWSTPWQISGENGRPGEDGDPGKDGKFIEFIYKHTTTKQESFTGINNPANWNASSGIDKNGKSFNDVDYIGPTSAGWTDNPQGIGTLDGTFYEFEYMSSRKFDGEKFGSFSTPKVWSRFGQNGVDGDGYEYIYKGFSETKDWSSIADNSNPNTWNTESNAYLLDEYYGPSGNVWSDDPVGVDSGTNKFVYMSARKKTNGTWGQYSIPQLWAQYVPPGTTGQNGSFRQWAYKLSATLVTPQNNTGGKSSPSNYPPTGWQDSENFSNIADDEFIWCSTRVISYDLNNNPIYGPWCAGYCISGEPGKDGEPGADGKYTEFIYKVFNSEQTWGTDLSNPANWEISQTEDYTGPSEYGWGDNPVGVTENNQYEYMSSRTYDGQKFSKFTTPVIWSKWGEKGQDGDGYEYIYKVLEEERLPGSNNWGKSDGNNNPENWEAVLEREYLGPEGFEWSDDPLDVNIVKAYEYVSTRKRVNGVWSKFSKPVLWSRYAIRGSNGENGDTPILAFQWNQSATTAPSPVPNGASLRNWTLIAPNRPNTPNSHLWMTQTIKHVATNKAVTYDTWSTPVRISGDKGENGEDGSNIEYIYLRLDEWPFPSSVTKPAKISSGEVSPNGMANGLDTEKNQNDWVPNGWYDTALAVEPEHKYVYMSTRTKPAGGNWSDFTEPILWSNWGELGLDGDGVQYIYKLFDHELNSSERDSLKPNNAKQNDDGEWMPSSSDVNSVNYGWSDEPISPTSSLRYCYCSVIKKINGSWGDFGKLALWTAYAEGGLTIDLSNEMDAFGTDVNGVVLEDLTVQTQVNLSYGTALQTIKELDAVAVNSSNVAIDSNIVQITTDNTRRLVTIVIKKDATLTYDIYIDITAECDLGSRTARFSLKHIASSAPGVSPTIYLLLPSMSSIPFTVDSNTNEYTPTSQNIKCGYIVNSGSSPVSYPNAVSTGTYNIYYKTDQNTGYTALTTSGVDMTPEHKYIEFILSKPNDFANSIDRETIPVIKDGKLGPEGPQGPVGPQGPKGDDGIGLSEAEKQELFDRQSSLDAALDLLSLELKAVKDQLKTELDTGTLNAINTLMSWKAALDSNNIELDKIYNNSGFNEGVGAYMQSVGVLTKDDTTGGYVLNHSTFAQYADKIEAAVEQIEEMLEYDEESKKWNIKGYETLKSEIETAVKNYADENYSKKKAVAKINTWLTDSGVEGVDVDNKELTPTINAKVINWVGSGFKSSADKTYKLDDNSEFYSALAEIFALSGTDDPNTFTKSELLAYIRAKVDSEKQLASSALVADAVDYEVRMQNALDEKGNQIMIDPATGIKYFNTDGTYKDIDGNAASNPSSLTAYLIPQRDAYGAFIPEHYLNDNREYVWDGDDGNEYYSNSPHYDNPSLLISIIGDSVNYLDLSNPLSDPKKFLINVNNKDVYVTPRKIEKNHRWAGVLTNANLDEAFASLFAANKDTDTKAAVTAWAQDDTTFIDAVAEKVGDGSAEVNLAAILKDGEYVQKNSDGTYSWKDNTPEKITSKYPNGPSTVPLDGAFLKLLINANNDSTIKLEADQIDVDGIFSQEARDGKTYSQIISNAESLSTEVASLKNHRVGSRINQTDKSITLYVSDEGADSDEIDLTGITITGDGKVSVNADNITVDASKVTFGNSNVAVEIAGKLSTSTFEAEKANITNLIAEKASIEDIEALDITTKTLHSYSGEDENAEGGHVVIENGEIHGYNIVYLGGSNNYRQQQPTFDFNNDGSGLIAGGAIQWGDFTSFTDANPSGIMFCTQNGKTYTVIGNTDNAYKNATMLTGEGIFFGKAAHGSDTGELQSTAIAPNLIATKLMYANEVLAPSLIIGNSSGYDPSNPVLNGYTQYFRLTGEKSTIPIPSFTTEQTIANFGDTTLKFGESTYEGYIYADDGGMRFYSDSTSGYTFYNGDVNVQGDVNATAINQSSDETLKNIISNTNLTLEEIANAPAVNFTWKDSRKGTNLNVGTIAQYWLTVLPEVIKTGSDGKLAMNYSNAAMVSSIITAKEVVALKDRVGELELENAKLKIRLGLIEQKLGL